MAVKDVVWCGMDWIDLDQFRDQWLAILNIGNESLDSLNCREIGGLS
jgi:hypothetical protein